MRLNFGNACYHSAQKLLFHICCQKHKNYVRFEVFTVVTMKSGVFWDVTLGISSQCASVASYS
jgi:hypothetical protein